MYVFVRHGNSLLACHWRQNQTAQDMASDGSTAAFLWQHLAEMYLPTRWKCEEMSDTMMKYE